MTVEIYLALQKRLKEFFPTDNVETYSYQDRDLQHNPLYAPENWLIEFLPIQWQNGGNETQQGELSFIVHHITQTGFSDQQRLVASGHFVKHIQLAKCLHQWRCNLSYIGIASGDTLLNRVTRVESAMDNELSNLIITRHRFSCQIWDYSANKIYQSIIANLRLEIWLAQNLTDNDRTDAITIDTTNP